MGLVWFVALVCTSWANNLAFSLLDRFMHQGSPDDINESIALLRKADSLSAPPHADRAGSLNNLASALRVRFSRNGCLDDLEECITLHRESLLHLPPTHVNHSQALASLGLALQFRSYYRDSVEDLEEAVEITIAGYRRKSKILSPQEKKIVAYHEIGHAIVAARQTHSAPVQKITIIPRTSGALGYTMQVEEEERYLLTKEELFNKIVTLTGGRTAEEIVFQSVTSS